MQNYEEWAKALRLDVDNDLTEEEYLKKRDVARKHNTESGYQKEIHGLAKSSALATLKRSIAAVDVMIAISLAELKAKKPDVYKTLNIKEIVNENAQS